MSPHSDVIARLERIKELWLELEKVRPGSQRYEELIGLIRVESAAYVALLEAKEGAGAVGDP